MTKRILLLIPAVLLTVSLLLCPEPVYASDISVETDTFSADCTALSLTGTTVEALADAIEKFPNLQSVELTEPEGNGALLCSLMDAHPGITFHWQKTVFGKTFSESDTVIDLSGNKLTLPEAEAAMVWFPKAEKLDLSNCGLDSETLATFREEKRSEYKVVWTVNITTIPARTDDIVFHAAAHGISVVDSLSTDLKYCEDMIVVDVGHSRLTHIEWVRNMPNLKYLIIMDNQIKDLTPITTCKNLVYLEVMKNNFLKDLSPITQCTALEDLNVSLCPRADLTPLTEMAWLKNLWANNRPMDYKMSRRLKEALPDTHVQAATGGYVYGGWRNVENYHKMRDIMGMPHNTW